MVKYKLEVDEKYFEFNQLNGIFPSTLCMDESERGVYPDDKYRGITLIQGVNVCG
jgi:hypothetical protein